MGGGMLEHQGYRTCSGAHDADLRHCERKTMERFGFFVVTLTRLHLSLIVPCDGH